MEGDTNALGTPELERELEQQASWMRRLARRLVRDADGAEDVVQEVRVAAWRHGEPVGRGWLARVASNFARRQRRDEATRAAHEQGGARADRAPAADELAARLDTQRALAEALGTLPEPYRSTLVRHFFDGWPAARIAREAGCPATTVRTRLERGLELLRERLDRRPGGRRAWLGALAPIALPPFAPPWLDPGSVPVSKVIAGALVMKSGLQVAVALAVVTVVGVGLLWRDDAPAAGAMELGASPAAVVAAADERGHAPLEADPRAPDAPRDAVVSPAPSPEIAAIPAALEPTRVEARIVDAQLRPLAGARATVATAANPTTVSDADGRVALAVDGLRADVTTFLRVEVRGWALTFVEAPIRPGRTTRLGDVVLVRAGAIAGRVVDVAGQPIAGARVLATPPGSWGGDLATARRCGPDSGANVPATTSGADGTFLLEGVAPGGVRAWAAVASMRFGVSAPRVVRAEETLADVELRVEALQREDEIAGVVLTPAGEPATGVALRLQTRSASSSRSWTDATGPDGRFRFRVHMLADHRIAASDAQGRWPEVVAAAVAPGTHDVVLRFAPVRHVAVRARAADGASVASFDVRAISEEGEVLERASAGPDGLAQLVVPGRPFHVECRAAGFAVERLGPFDPRGVLDTIAFELDAQAGLRGRVLAAGQPLAGARVTLWRASSPAELVEVHGYPTLREPRSIDEARTDGEGRFFLRVGERADHYVRADAEGFAASEIGPLDVDPRSPPGDLELALGRGGRIEGVVRVAAGKSDEGVLVAANRGDGHVRTLRTGAGGAFAFEQLTAGPWSVTRGRIEVVGDPLGNWSTSTAAKPTKLAASCTVREGETSRVVVDLRDDAPAVITGRLTVDGAPAARWTLKAWPGDTNSYSGELPSTALDERGEFTLALDEPGPVRLSFDSGESDAVRMQLDARLELARGANAWNGAVATGRVEGRAARPTADDYWHYVLVEGDGTKARVAFKTDADGRFVMPRVLAGRAKFCAVEVTDGQWGNSLTLREATIAPGTTTSVELR